MPVSIAPTHSAIDTYYANLDTLKKGLKLTSEGSTRRAFSALLDETSSVRKWTLAEEVTKRTKKRPIRLDGVLYGKGSLPRGYWEAKDEDDDLDAEILKKKAKDYPVSNIIFEDTSRAVLIQDNVEVEDIEVSNRDDLARLLTRFYNYDMEPFVEFDKAVDWFAEVIPDIGRDLQDKIAEAHKSNKQFQREFDEFMELCKSSLNPNISKEAVDEMLIQHLLTERLIRNIFQGDFTQRNVIANKVEDVISALTRPLFDRADFQKSLDTFYQVIENAAKSLANDYQEKQNFINNVYEQFFQGYSVKVADTHGIVYTPQEIVDFMCAAVEEVLHDEFGKKLGQDGVAVLDPCTGTGNFIINLLNRVNPKYRREFYKKHLFANEVMLMPYYIASLNIEHEYYFLENTYEPFEGISFVDTLDLAKKKQLSFDFMTEKNSARVKRQQETDITVIIGNPPYNLAQVNENDNNKNRSYDVIDDRVQNTYGKDSTATLNRALYDPYVKFFRWATDRLGDKDGVVCFVTNNSFVDQTSFDGMRKHLLQDFTHIYHLDLHGNARKNAKLSGTTHNVFGIQVGVGITVAVRNSTAKEKKLFYYRVPEMWRKEKKLGFLTWNVNEDGSWNSLNTIEWNELQPNEKYTWLVSEFFEEFSSYIPVSDKNAKSASSWNTETIFKTYSLGVATNRDVVVYDFDKNSLVPRIQNFIEGYNSEVDRFIRSTKEVKIDEFVDYDKLNWSSTLKNQLKSGNYAEYSEQNVRFSMYRPFTRRMLFYKKPLIDRPGLHYLFYPNSLSEQENKIICATGIGSERPFANYITNNVPDLNFFGPGTVPQWFPFYVYDEDGNNRRENITDWALAQFREYYGTPPQSPHSNGGKDDGEHSNGGKDDGEHSNGGMQEPEITKWDIFYYVYGLLHHPDYRERYADNLKRELPRVPFVPTPTPSPSPKHWRGESESPVNEESSALKSPPNALGGDLEGGYSDVSGSSGFWAFSRAGKKLAEIHLNYEKHPRYDGIEWVTNPDVKADYRVEKMRPKKKRKVKLSEITSLPQRLGGDLEGVGEAEITVYDTLQYNAYLTLTGIPEKAFAYRLGNRSAIDWIVDQYRVKTDKRSGIVSDPNGYSDDEQYIVQLIERVVQVSVDTVEIVEALAKLPFREV